MPLFRGAADGGTGTGRWVERALKEHQDRNLTRVTVARTLMFVTIGAWLLVNYGPEVFWSNVPNLLLFVAFGLAAFWLMHGRPERGWLGYLFVLLDALLLGWVMFAPGQNYPDGWPWQMSLRLPLFLFFLTLPALALLAFRPGLVLWAGLVSCLTVAFWTWRIALEPTSVVGLHGHELAAPELSLERYMTPTYVHPDDAIVRIFVFLLVAAILALAAWRTRQLIFEQVEAARARENLARYVAPSMVERLARSDSGMGEVRSQEVAVLFADIRGFTAIAETLSPVATMELLRAFHGRMAEIVFAHGGTLDKFIGDGLMATFGTPETAPDDAARALACARRMLAAIAAWNVERRARGLTPIEIGIGLHHGPVTTGDIGGAHRFEFAVIGDTVNIANRLEALTRVLDVPILLSDAARKASGAPADAFLAMGQQQLRGRSAPVGLWTLRPATPVEAPPLPARDVG